MTNDPDLNGFLQTESALSVFARNIQIQRDQLEIKIAHSISSKIMPIIEELRQEKIPEKCLIKLNIIATYLSELVPWANSADVAIMTLSSAESRVAALIKHGFSTTNIARLLHISEHTVKSHRRAIRKKLGIWNSKIDLSSYLSSAPLPDLDPNGAVVKKLGEENGYPTTGGESARPD